MNHLPALSTSQLWERTTPSAAARLSLIFDPNSEGSVQGLLFCSETFQHHVLFCFCVECKLNSSHCWVKLIITDFMEFFLVSATKVPSLPQETSQFSEHRLNMALGVQSAEGAAFQDVDDPVAHPFSPLSEYLKPRFSGSTPWRSFFFFSFVLLHHACPLPSPMFLREAASNLLILSYICSTDFLCRPWREDFSH